MLNSQLCMPENEQLKKRLLDNVMTLNPGLGDMEFNKKFFDIHFEECKASGLFTPALLGKISRFWEEYEHQVATVNYYKKPWYKRIFTRA